MSAGKRRREKADSRGAGFFLFPECLLKSEAFRTSSPRSVKVLLAFCARHNGFNNGAIAMGFRDLADITDSQNHKANSDAICQLIERGMLALEKSYPRGQRLANEYRLTFVPVGDEAATNDYLTWKSGDAGTRRKPPGQKKSRVAIASTRKGVRVVTATTGDETSRCEDRNGGHENPPFSGEPPVVKATTLSCNHLGDALPLPPKSPANTGGPLSAAPDPQELRERVLAVLDNSVRGSQGQLAAMASIRPAALSKFLHGGGPLNDQSRIRLTCALPKLMAAPSQRDLVGALA